ncbi:autotransporter-associated beta strand repeat-containing protein [Roseibium sp. M-1]
MGSVLDRSRKTSISHRRLRIALLACTALVAPVALPLAPVPALAQTVGGAGGNGGDAYVFSGAVLAPGLGGAPGLAGDGSTTGTYGQDGGDRFGSIGGVGGEADSGGQGGSSTFYLNLEPFSGEGGGGGGAGGAGTVINATQSVTSDITGGAGGYGGDGLAKKDTFGPFIGGGGGGGGGGSGIVLGSQPDQVVTIEAGVTVTGGQGGQGGAADTQLFFESSLSNTANGYGGQGGSGISAFSSTGTTILNQGTIRGGDGGLGGVMNGAIYTIVGTEGSGGYGVAGGNLTIVNSGIIAGGLTPSGGTNAAILIDGGTNSITTLAGGTTGSIVLGGGVTALAGAITGALTVYAGATATISGATSDEDVTGITALTNSGTVSIGTDRILSVDSVYNAGTIDFGGGATLQSAGDIENIIGATFNFIGPDGTATLSSGSGNIYNDGQMNVLAGDVAVSGNVTNRYDSTLLLSGGNMSGIGTLLNQNNASISISSGYTLGVDTLTVTGGTLTGEGAIDASAAFNLSSGTIGLTLVGTGALTKTGSDALVLTGENTFSGGTTISAGTLQIGDGGTRGVMLGVVTNDGILAFNRSDDSTFSGSTSGSGSLRQLGSGTLTLSGENTYSGGTVISAGTLEIGAGGTSGSIAGDVDNSGTLAFNRSDDVTFGGIISGSGAVSHLGAGTTTLTGANTYSGGTTISAGTLRLGGGGSLDASGDVTIGSSGTFDLNGNDQTVGALSGAGIVTLGSGTLTAGNGDATSTFSGAIGGTGGLVKTGLGTLTLSGSNTFTGGTSISAGTLAFGSSDDVTFGSVISGSGAVSQVGAGTLTLSGTNTYSGGTRVSSGVLAASSDANLGDASGGLTLDGGTLRFGAAFDLAATRVVTLASGGIIDTNGFDTTLASAIVGSGGLSKIGEGVLTLTGSNTYSGGTTISGGVLAASSDASLGDASGGLTLDGGTLQFGAAFDLAETRAFTLASDGSIDTNGFDTTLAQVVSGSGGLTKTGGGTLTLTGSNTYSGGTTISGGVLATSSDANLGDTSGSLTLDDGTLRFGASFDLSATRAVTLASGGTIDINGFDTTLAQVVSGSGGLTKSGGGTLTLAGSNIYSGGTTISGGALAVASDANLGDTSGSLTLDDGTLRFGASFDLSATRAVTLASAGTIDTNGFDTTLAQAVSGSGGLTKTGDGTLTLTGTNIYSGGTTVSGGTLEVSSDASLGAASGGLAFNGGTLRLGASFDMAERAVRIEQNSTLDTNGFSTTLSQGISGSSLLTKTGAGTLTIDGDSSSFDGYFFARGGSIALTGVIGGGAEVDNGAEVTVSGPDAAWTARNGLYVGYIGAGRLTVENGAAVHTDSFNAGGNSGSSGEMLLTGEGSRWVNTTYFHVGNYSGGTGTLTIADHGELVSGGGAINSGVMIVKEGARFSTSQDFYIGLFGDGALTVESGGTADNSGQDAQLGSIGTSWNGTATVSGAGSAWTGIGELTIGTDGAGSLRVEDGGTVNSTIAFLSTNTGSGTAVVTGTGSEWQNTGALYIGYNAGGGTLTIADGGTVAAGSVNVGFYGIGTLNIGAAAGETATGAGTLDVSSVNVAGGSKIVFNHTETDYEFASNITGAGSLEFQSGTTTLSGTNTYTGATTVSGGMLVVNGSIASPSLLTVEAGATISGTGTLPGMIINGTLSAGNSPGTLTINGDLTLGASSISLFELTSAGVAGGSGNDLVNVTGNLTLGGELQVTDAVSGYYRLFNVGGTTSGSFAIIPTDTAVLTNVANQVNLLVSTGGQAIQFWDGADTSGNGSVDGGSAVWDASATNWTGAPGAAGINDQWLGEVGVFAGTAGTVTVSGPVAFEGLQFSSDGYVISGGGLNLSGDSAGNTSASFVNVNNGVSVEISSVLTGASGIGLDKIGAGTLVLTGNNTYDGVTTIGGGTLQLGNGGNSGSIAGDVVNTGTLTFNRSNNNTLSGDISGTGNLQVVGSGTTTLTGNNSYTGGTTITWGTLQAGSAGALVDDTAYSVNGGGRLDLNGFDLTVSELSGTSGYVSLGTGTLTINQATDTTLSGGMWGDGALVKSGSGTFTLDGYASHSGGTTITGGTLALGSSLSLSGAVTVNDATLDLSPTSYQQFATLAGNSSGTVRLGSYLLQIDSGSTDFAGSIVDGGGSGGLTISGGTQTLSGVNTYTGGTQINSGATLALKDGGSIANSGYVGFYLDGTLDISQTTDGASVGGLYEPFGSAVVALGSKTLTITSGSYFAGSIQDGGIGGGTGGSLVIANGASQQLHGYNSFTGSTTINAGGELILADAGSLAASSGISTNGIFDISGLTSGVSASIKTLTGSGEVWLGGREMRLSGGGSFSGTVSDCGSGGYSCYGGGTGGRLTLDSGTLTLSGANTYTGGTTIGNFSMPGAATLVVGNSSALGTGTVSFNGSGVLQAGTDGLIFSNNFSVGPTVGTFDSNGHTMSISGDIADGGDAGDLRKTGTGTLTLSGTNTYTGETLVEAGTLLVNGSIASSSGVTVDTGATIGGTGTISRTIVNGTLSAGNSPGTLTVDGNLTLGSTSVSLFELGRPGVVGGASNDLVNVTGDLTLGGTLQTPGATSGYYRLFTVGGSVSGAFDTMPTDATLLTGVASQVDLLVRNNGQLLQFWDGTDTAGNGTVDGGTATWTAGATNWTDAPGQAEINGDWQGEVGVFAGTAGTVTVSGPIAFQGLQFSTDGYVVTGDALTLTGDAYGNTAASFVTADAGVTIEAVLTGSGIGLDKLGAGTLVLTGNNIYDGTTTISGGTLQLGDGGSSGSIQGDVVNDGILAFNRANNFQLKANISGTGSVQQIGSGATILSGNNSYTGGTTVSAGTLQAGASGGFAANTTYAVAGGILDLNSFDLTISSLSGNGGEIRLGSAALTVSQSDVTSFAGAITGAGSLNVTGTGVLTLSGSNSYTGGTTVTAGALRAGGNGALVADTAYSVNGGALDLNGFDLTMSSLSGSGGVVSLGTATLTVDQDTHTSFAGDVGGFGGLVKTGSGQLTITGLLNMSGGTTVAAGVLKAGAEGAFSSNSAFTVNGGTLDLGGFDVAMASLSGAGGEVVLGDALLTLIQKVDTTYAGGISGTGGLAKFRDGTLVLSGNNSYSGGTTVSAGTLRAGADGAFVDNTGYVVNGGTLDLNGFDLTMSSLSGNGGEVALGSAGLTVDQTVTTAFQGVISGGGSLAKTGSGQLILSGTSTYTGQTFVDGGLLSVNGDLSSSSLLTVRTGGTLGGSGVLPSIVVNGGTLAPGNSIGTVTVSGNLTFGAGSTYLVEVSSSGADRTNVTGVADLTGATVALSYEAGSYIERSYTIVSADGGLGGTTFAGLTGTVPTGFTQSLDYNSGEVSLVLDLELRGPSFSNLNRNQQSVADAIVTYFDTNGGLPAEFAALDANGLTAVSGEIAAGAIRAGIESTDQFLEVVSDQALSGSSNGETAFGQGDVDRVIEARWQLWGSAYGRLADIEGDADTGSHDVSADIFGTVGGIGRRWDGTALGMALGIGSSNFSLSNGLGSGSADTLNAGAFAHQDIGDAYLLGAAAYGYHAVKTGRDVFGNSLSADFDGHSIAGRIEAGYRIATSLATVTPFASFQATGYRLPSYDETGSGSFALSYEDGTTTALQTSLGARLERIAHLADGSVLAVRGGAELAINGGGAPRFNAAFQTLPGSSFTILGAEPDRFSALLNAGLEYRAPTGFFATAVIHSELSGNLQSLSGNARVGFNW